MKTITVTNGAGYSLAFAQRYSGGFVLTNATGILEAKADVIRTDNAMSDGSIWNSSRLKERAIVLTIRDDPSANHRQLRMRLYRLFQIKAPLTLSYTDGTATREIDVYTESVTCDVSKRANTYTVSLIAPDPFFRDAAATEREVAAWEGAFEFPADASAPDTGLFEFDADALDTDVLEFGTRTEDLIVSCENAGDVPCGMVITFLASGSVTNPGLLNVDSGERLSLNLAMQAGDAVTVDTRFGRRTAVLTRDGAAENVFRCVDAGSTFLQLAVGENNFTAMLDGAAAASADLDISVWYEQQYVGA